PPPPPAVYPPRQLPRPWPRLPPAAHRHPPPGPQPHPKPRTPRLPRHHSGHQPRHRRTPHTNRLTTNPPGAGGADAPPAAAASPAKVSFSDQSLTRSSAARPEALFGPVASMPAAWRLLDRIDEAHLPRVRAARAVARQRAWQAGAAPGPGGELRIDVDATITIAHSEKQNASATWKKTFGFHPLLAFLDRPEVAGGEGL